jgi:RNA polymerase sigma-70 factor, ECF subfamily
MKTEAFYEHLEFLCRSLRSLGVQEEAVEDAAQDVYVVVHRRAHDFRGEAHPRTWLFAVARRVAWNYRRAARRREARLVATSFDEHDTALHSADAGPLETVARRQAVELLDRLLEDTGDQARKLFVLVEVAGMTVGEAAEALSMNHNTAYTRFRTARPAFAAAVERAASLLI